MTYTEAQSKLSRTRIDKIIITMDYCANTFGVTPCTATGEKCYNTYFTCKDKNHFIKTTKTYEFVNGDIPVELAAELFPARPYIKNISDIPTEIKENDTSVGVMKITLLDEPDGDIGTDPYYKTRTSIQGTYWKKWLARNPNYKGRKIERYEGFWRNGELSDFKKKYEGIIENISVADGSVTIEVPNILKKLSEISYPLESKYSLKFRAPNYFNVSSQNDMLALPAVVGDYAERSDLGTLNNFVCNNSAIGGSLPPGVYSVTVVAYDSSDRPLANKTAKKAAGEYGHNTGSISISWDAVSGASSYNVYIKKVYTIIQTINLDDGVDAIPIESYVEVDNPVWILNKTVTTPAASVINTSGVSEDPPTEAQNIYILTADDPTTIGNWEQNQGIQALYIDANSDLDSSGYILIEDEVIYYTAKITGSVHGTTVDALLNVKRKQLDTEASEHAVNTKLHYIFNYSAGNGFTIAKDILDKANILSYADTQFNTYETLGTDIDFSCAPFVKETKLNKIFFDLINVLGCICWQGEDGKIKIKKRDEDQTSYDTITDEANIIANSGNVDLNETSRFTNWILYWHKWDVAASQDEKEAYSYGYDLQDEDAISENEYNDVNEDVQQTLWINTDCGTFENISNYILALLTSRKNRTRDAQPIYECRLEMKDGNIETGEIILLSTNDIENADGTPYTNEKFRVIKKQPAGGTFNAKFIKENQLAI